MKVEFLKSATDPKHYPPSTLPEVAMVGRSNAGKSSYINAWLNQRAARVSSTPGKTRHLNFFKINEKYQLVDMPGYGFTKRSKNEILDWNRMVEEYFGQRNNLCGVMLIMDIRRDWDDEDQAVADWLFELDIPMLILLNKADKLSRSQIMARQRVLVPDELKDRVFTVSAEKKIGMTEVEDYIFSQWITKFKGRK
jgi:GTP-binding protein